jgi:Flp pilus assembly protein TadG
MLLLEIMLARKNQQISVKSAFRARDEQGGTPRMLLNMIKHFRRNASRFGIARQGTTIVEFAFIAPIFLALLIAIFETTLFLFAQANLQNAAVAGSRLFLTGQAQNSNMTQSQFINQICPAIQALFDCSKLIVNVQSYSDFASANGSAPTLTYNNQGQVTNNWSFNPGAPGQVMVVQLIYQWPIVGGPLGYVLPNNANGNAEMMGVTAFRVEP